MPRSMSSDSATLPQLTHQPSFESGRWPITPVDEVANPLADPRIATTDHDIYDIYNTKEPKLTPPMTATFKEQQGALPQPNTTQMTSKDLPFLAHDPYARDEVILFDKSKPISRSRSGSVRSILSTSSMQSVKRGFGSIKRRFSRKSSTRQKMERKPKANPEAAGFQPPPPGGQDTCTQRVGSSKGPQRADNEEYNVDYVCW